VDVVLVDRHNYHLFTPLLYQVATALLNPSDIAYPNKGGFPPGRERARHLGRSGRGGPGDQSSETSIRANRL
jgi:NADH dehydrogenase